MTLRRIRLRLKAPLGTPLSSGTLFGHLCWARREAEGEAALVRWLAALPEAPWALSDGFPADLLPRPIVRRVPSPRPERMTREALGQLEEDKRRRKLAWVKADDWPELRSRVSDPLLDACATSGLARPHRLAHNTIDHRTGSTPDEGGLYFVDEDWSHADCPERDVYVRADASDDDLRMLFTAVGEAGYGRDASLGRGHFTVDGVDDAGWLDDHEGCRRMSLSHGAVTANMSAPRYRLYTHYGKLGASALAEGAIAWKHPILLTRPGATFAAADAGPFGAWLTHVHQERPEVGHNAFHVAIPFTEVGEGGRP